MKRPDWLTAPIIIGIVALFTGGLGGALFNAWYNRESPLVIGYLISTTSTGTDTTTKSLVPGLSLRINAKDIPAIHTHVISLSRTSGYADRVEIAATFNQPLQVFGSAFVAPSPVHSISCQLIASGSKCVLGPLDGQGEYRISLATDSATAPVLTVAGRNVQLASLAEIASRSIFARDPIFLFGILTGIIGVVANLVIVYLFTARLSRRRRSSVAVSSEEEGLPEDDDGLHVGAKVKHSQFGLGTVLAIETHNGDRKLTVKFDRVGTKKLLEKYAKLEIL